MATPPDYMMKAKQATRDHMMREAVTLMMSPSLTQAEAEKWMDDVALRIEEKLRELLAEQEAKARVTTAPLHISMPAPEPAPPPSPIFAAMNAMHHQFDGRRDHAGRFDPERD